MPRDTFLSFEGVHLRHDERVIDVFPEPQMARPVRRYTACDNMGETCVFVDLLHTSH